MRTNLEHIEQARDDNIVATDDQTHPLRHGTFREGLASYLTRHLPRGKTVPDSGEHVLGEVVHGGMCWHARGFID